MLKTDIAICRFHIHRVWDAGRNRKKCKEISWWHHDMRMLSILLAICGGIHWCPVDFPHKGLVMLSFDFMLLASTSFEQAVELVVIQDIMMFIFFHLPSAMAPSLMFTDRWVNSLWPSYAIWLCRSGSILAKVMPCCLTAQNHYLNPYWHIINCVPWHSTLKQFYNKCSRTLSVTPI